MGNITTDIENIRSAVYGREVRESIADAIEQVYEDATQTDPANTNLEVIQARSTFANLNARENAQDAAISTEATARKNADNVLQSTINAEASARTAQDSVLSARMDTFASLPSGSTSGNAELLDIRVQSDGVTAASAGDAVRNQVNGLKSDVAANSLANNQVIYFDGAVALNGSSNWASRTFNRNVSKWNGTFGSGADNYYTDLLYPVSYSASFIYVRDSFTSFTNLQIGHTYRIDTYVLSGGLTVGSGQIAEVGVYGITCVPIGSSTTFTYSGVTTKFYLHFSKGVSLTEAVIGIIVTDISQALPDGVSQVRLSGYKWKQGRHITRGNSIDSPSEVLNTLSMIEAIPYDPSAYFVLKSGYKAAFVSVENNIVTGIAAAFMSTAGRIDMIDVYNNLSKADVNVFGDSLAIMIRKSDDSNITITDVIIDDAIEMYVVDKKGSATKPKTWVAIGDSITDGRYSQLDGSNVRTKTNHFCQYGYIASKILGVDYYVEHGYGGMGYVHVANDGTYLTDVLALDLGSPDIITVCLGVNDRSQTLGDENSTANNGTISGAIRNCCEVLGAAYPNAHIIFMTPINATATGSANTGWCKRSGPTHLEDIAGMIKYWAGLYGFPVIDMLNECPINDFNIQTMILDQLHPTMEAHYMVGKYLAGAMPYKTI